MGAISVTAASVKLMNENEVIKIRGTVGATVTPGQPVYLDGTNGWKPADADAAASGMARLSNSACCSSDQAGFFSGSVAAAGSGGGLPAPSVLSNLTNLSKLYIVSSFLFGMS